MALTDVLGDIADFSNPYGPSARGKWKLVRGVYTNAQGVPTVLYIETKGGYENLISREDPSNATALEQIEDTGGRRLVKFEYPYIDGGLVEDLGRMPEVFTFNLKFFGENHQKRFDEFMFQVVNQSGTGTLTHPMAVRKAIPARFKDYTIINRYDEWNCITIKATFWEDNLGAIKTLTPLPSIDSLLRSALQTLTNIQSAISTLMTEIGALLLLPGALINSMKARLNSIVGQFSRLLGQLAATFSSNPVLKSLFGQSSKTNGNVVGINSGTITRNVSGQSLQATLPPVYQVGFDPATQTAINNQISAFVNASQVTPQQAVYSANQVRASIITAINEVTTIMGNSGFDIMLQYRGLAVAIQESIEACIAATQSQVKIYTTPSAMSVRTIAVNNGLSPDRQNDIVDLNPLIPSINYIPKGYKITVPAS